MTMTMTMTMTERERTLAMIAACAQGQNGHAPSGAVDRALDQAAACGCADCRRAVLSALAGAIWLAG